MGRDRIELVLDARAETGEGPVWDHRDQTVVWVDITRGEVHRLNPVTGVDRCTQIGQHVGALALRARGELVVAIRGGYAGLDFASGRLEPIADTEASRPANRMNDGKVDASGRFWAGSMAYSEQGQDGSLFRLDPDRSVTRILGRVGISNGLGWSPDNRVMYHIDSLSAGVDAYDFELVSGTIGAKRRLIDVPYDQGVPDGMAVDAEGGLWVAMWNGSAVRRYTPDGKPAGVVHLPVRKVTSCAFGGPDFRDLYITTAARDLSAQDLSEQPGAGGLFRHQPGVAGMASPLYAG